MEIQHHEATVLSFVKITTPSGYTHSITIRQGATEQDITKQLSRISRLDTALAHMNWRPAEGQRPAAAQSHSGRPPAAGNGNGSQSHDDNMFDCQSLACTIDSGKQYWKISDRSQRWKYPVTIYPEVLQKYFQIDGLDPTLIYPLNGWKAIFEKNDKGYPKKVIALYRPDETPKQPQTQPAQQPAPTYGDGNGNGNSNGNGNGHNEIPPEDLSFAELARITGELARNAPPETREQKTIIDIQARIQENIKKIQRRQIRMYDEEGTQKSAYVHLNRKLWTAGSDWQQLHDLECEIANLLTEYGEAVAQ